MSFLDHFSEAHRQRFEALAQRLVVARGEYLMRRGEAGGDICVLVSGTLEVVDSRTTPEVILASLAPGAVVGELSFVDGSPRSADVRAATEAEVLQWPRQDLSILLSHHPALAAEFYRVVALLAADRARSLTASALAGGLGRAVKPQAPAGLARVRDEARSLAEDTKQSLLDIEMRLRKDPSDAVAHQALPTLLERLQDDVTTLAMAHPEPGATEEATRILGRELHPYLVRSCLAERCIRRPQGLTGTAEILAHVLVNAPGGDGQLGELVDRWLLDQPTLRAMRALREPLLELVADRLPTHRNRRVMLLNAGTGSLVAGLMQRLGRSPTVLTVIDQSRDALSFLDASIAPDTAVELVPVQENLAQFALGRRRRNFVQQDVIVVHSLVEYLPSRLVVSLLRTLGRLLVPGGTVALTALAPSPDEALLDRLLSWPTIRRTPDALHRLFEAGWVNVEGEVPVGEPGLLFYGSPDPVQTAQSTYTAAVAPVRPPQ